MGNKFDFTSDRVDVFLMLIDASSSMDRDACNVIAGVDEYKKEFLTFPEKGSIAVSISTFADDFEKKPFLGIDEINFSYNPDGYTALYYSICEGADYLKTYIQQIIEKKAIFPKATFIVFSDGEPCRDRKTETEAINAINELKYMGVTTVFVAFGKSINSDFGENLGFQAVQNVSNRADAKKFFGEKLSKSCKEQSRSLKGLGANFFSKAMDGDNSSEYSSAADEVLENDSWIDDI